MLMKFDRFILNVTNTPLSDRVWAYTVTVVPALYGLIGTVTLFIK